MPNIIRVQVDNAADLLNASMYDAGALIRLQRSATETGAYSDVTTAAIVAGTSLYTLYDTDGTSSSWYRTRYENASTTRTSDWSPVFQAGGADAGMLCSYEDVAERLFGTGTPSNTEKETLLDIIREVSSTIERATGRWLRPRPSSGTTELLMDTEAGHMLWFPKGIRSISTLEVALSDQPDTGGTYTTLAGSTYSLWPSQAARDEGWPATGIRLLSSAFGSAVNGVRITGGFGWAETPPDIRAVAIEATTRRYIGKETAAPAVAVGPTGGVRLLTSLSPDSKAVIEAYRWRGNG